MPALSPPFIIDGIPCEYFVPAEGAQSITESYGPGGPVSTLLIKCAWANRQQVIRALLGINGQIARTIIRIPPLPYNDAPTTAILDDILHIEGPFWVVTSIPNVTGIGFRVDQETGFGFYDEAVIQAQCTVPTYNPVRFDPGAVIDITRIPFCTTTIRTGTEVFVPPTKGSVFFFSGDHARSLPNSQVGLLQVHFEFEVTRHLMPLQPIFEINKVSGHVNNNVINAEDLQIQEEHLLFLMGEVTTTADPATGGRLWEVPLRFLYNSAHGWNEFMNNDGVYEKVSTDLAPVGKPPYPQADLSRILGINF